MLSRRMSLRAFENGYWYQTELVAFGKELGLSAAHRMRKNELEPPIKARKQHPGITEELVDQYIALNGLARVDRTHGSVLP